MQPKNLKVVIAVAAVLIIGLGIFFWQDMVNSWHASQKHHQALELVKQQSWIDAMIAEHDATELRPGSAEYQLAYTQIRRGFMKAIKPQLAQLDPVAFLAKVHDLTTELGPALDDDGDTQLHSWCLERETPALEEATAPFDADMDALGKVFRGRESYFADLFSPGNQSKARALLNAWQGYDAVEAAWKGSNPDRVAALLEKIPADYRKGIFDSFQKRLDGVRKDIKDSWDAANKLVIQNDYLGAKAIFTNLQPHEAWIPGLAAARLAAQSGGEGYYTEKMVEANLAKQYHDAGGWLGKLLTLQGQDTQGINFDEVFKGGTTADFLALLTRLGLHPASGQERKGYTDILLVSANLDNLTDKDAAHQFLSTTYLDWATKEFQNAHFGNASYLSLLAAKHGNPAAGEVFDKSRAAILNQVIITVDALPVANQTTSASKDFSDDLYLAAVNTVHESLLPWMKYEDAGNPVATNASTTLLRVKIKAGVTKFSSDYQRNVRQVSREFPIKVTVDNPDLPQARDRVDQAQANLSAAQSKYQSDKQQAAVAGQAARLVANQIFGGLGGAIAGGIAGGAVANSVSTAGVDQAAQALTEARNNLENMPRQVEQTQNKLFSWNETDYTTTFVSTFQIGLGVADDTAWSQSFSATLNHKSTERRGIDQVRLEPMDRELPDQQKVEGILASDLKNQIHAITGNNVLTGIKTSLQKTCASGGANPETAMDLQLAVEFLWWDSPLRNYQALGTPALLGRFGDVVPEGTTPVVKPAADIAQVPTPAPPAAPSTPTAPPQPATLATVTSAPTNVVEVKTATNNLAVLPPPTGVVVVTGEIQNPGISIPCRDNDTLPEIIQAAGGFTELANTNAVRVFPQGKLKDAFTLDSAKLPEAVIHPGDHVIVPRR